VNEPSFEERVAQLRHDIVPLALASVAELAARAERVLAGDEDALTLARSNFARKARLMALGASYALGVAPAAAPALVATLVRWGALFTMIDTAIDERGICEPAACDRLASFLVVGAAPREPTTPLERLLAELGHDIDSALRRLPRHHLLAKAIAPRLAKHARLVTYQHIAPAGRDAYLLESGAGSYIELCGDGSPAPVFAMVRAATRLGEALDADTLTAIADEHVPEFGVLHVYADDLADLHEDRGRKDLNLAALAAGAGRDPHEEVLSILGRYLARLPRGSDALFWLRLMLHEYQRAADEAGQVAALETFAAAARAVRAAEGR
jgi:hypothetical protein